MLKVFASLVVCVILIDAQTTRAEDAMYRCGNTYQDTPCKGVVSKPINEPKPKKANITVHQSAPVAPAEKKVAAAKQQPSTLQTDCKKRGEDAKLIAKLREIGVPEQDQLAISTSDSAKITLIKKVYSTSGNAFQIQNAIEKECLQQNQKTSLTSQWMAKAKKMLGFGTASSKPKPAPAKVAPKPTQPQIRSTADPKPIEIPPAQMPAEPMPMPPAPQPAIEPAPAPAPVAQPEPVQAPPEPAPAPPPPPQPAPPPPPQPAPTPAAKAAPAAEPATQEAPDDPQGICSSLKAGLKNVADEKRKGGDTARMTDLKNQQIQLENIYKSSGC